MCETLKRISYNNVHNKAIFIINHFLFLYDTENADTLLQSGALLDNNEENGRRATQPLSPPTPKYYYNNVCDLCHNHLLFCIV